MSRSVGVICVVGSAALLAPYLFYALIFRGLIGYLWVMLCIVAFVVWVLSLKQHSLELGLASVTAASAAIALTSMGLGSALFSSSLLIAGGIVFGLFYKGMAELRRAAPSN